MSGGEESIAQAIRLLNFVIAVSGLAIIILLIVLIRTIERLPGGTP